MTDVKALVTGSTGFIGAHLCDGLLSRGYAVRAFHRPTSSTRLLDGLDVEHAVGDLTQPDTILPALEGVEVIFHAAAWMGGFDSTGQQYAVTVEGTRNVLHAAQKLNVNRVVHTSSVAALGAPERAGRRRPTPPLLIDEQHTWNYRPDLYPYGYAKYLAEMEVQKTVAMGLDVVIVNPTLVFGGGDIYRQANSIVTQVAQQRLRFATEGGINCAHIDDVVEGHLAALNRGQTGQRYILGGENLTYLELLRVIAEVVGVPAPTQVIPASLLRLLAGPAQTLRAFLNLPISPDLLRMAGRYFFYDTCKAEDELGLRYHRPFQQAVTEAYHWFQMGKSQPD